MTCLRTVKLSEIKVGPRLRQSLGPTLSLTASIERVGLLHPLVLNSRMELVSGRRRLHSVQKLGWAEVPAVIVSTLDEATAALRAELDENTCREPLTPTEIIERGRQLEAIEKPEAKSRQSSTLKQNQDADRGGNLPPRGEGKTRDKVGKTLGVSGKTYEKGKQVVEAAEKDPGRFGDLPAKMNAKGIDPAHKEMKRRSLKPCPFADALQTVQSAVKAAVAAWAGRSDWKDPAGAAKHLEELARELMRQAAILRSAA